MKFSSYLNAFFSKMVFQRQLTVVSQLQNRCFNSEQSSIASKKILASKTSMNKWSDKAGMPWTKVTASNNIKGHKKRLRKYKSTLHLNILC